MVGIQNPDLLYSEQALYPLGRRGVLNLRNNILPLHYKKSITYGIIPLLVIGHNPRNFGSKLNTSLNTERFSDWLDIA